MRTAVDIGTLIETSPEIRKGLPCIAGAGVTVRRIVLWKAMLSGVHFATTQGRALYPFNVALDGPIFLREKPGCELPGALAPVRLTTDCWKAKTV